ncbi:serine hydrolase [Brachybacterium sacelli]|uniref:Beta-lactamase class A n=1 Tax=Brachybacterium sacelli TaxID=173364 RepID=A0ABS4WZE2_9MICO|nr:serine hydrolase [Brachybacterium sacelli]MBP2381567.1 beta-lactamase class A [Brachybacterium sacelli]
MRVGSEFHEVTRRVREELDAAGLSASILARDLGTGVEIALDADRTFPAASLVKLPLGAFVLGQIHRGELDPARPVAVAPQGISVPGPAGTTRFRHEARVAVEDLVTLAITVSDNAAADALLTVVGPEQVNAWLSETGLAEIRVRHTLSTLHARAPDGNSAEHTRRTHVLAQRGGSASGHHAMPEFDRSRASIGTARAFATLLTEIWRPTAMPQPVAARLRELLHANVHRQRLAPDLASDASRWASKTGTLLNLRHEVGTLEEEDGSALVLCALSASRVPAGEQPAADAALGAAARQVRDALRAAFPREL